MSTASSAVNCSLLSSGDTSSSLGGVFALEKTRSEIKTKYKEEKKR